MFIKSYTPCIYTFIYLQIARVRALTVLIVLFNEWLISNQLLMNININISEFIPNPAILQ